MLKLALLAVASLFFLVSHATLLAQSGMSAAVVFSEPGFPAAVSADSAGPSPQQLAVIFPGAQLADADHLRDALAAPSTRLLVLRYGSSFPEEAWPAIKQFLDRGGNLLVLGGMPFTRAAYRDSSGWHLRDYSVRFARALMIDQYQTTPGSEGLQFQPNLDLPATLPRFTWGHAFSPVIRLSSVDLYQRGGAAGSIDARLDALAWGVKEGRKLAAPAIEIDHLRNGFGGGRWVFLNSELAPDFYSGPASAELVQTLADLALRGSEEFNVHPELPLYFPDEPIQLEVDWHTGAPSTQPLAIRVTSYPAVQAEGQPQPRSGVTSTLPSLAERPLFLPAPKTQGLYIIEAELLEGDQGSAKVRAIHR